MDAVGAILLALFAAALTLGVPIAALVIALRATGKIGDMERRLARLEGRAPGLGPEARAPYGSKVAGEAGHPPVGEAATAASQPAGEGALPAQGERGSPPVSFEESFGLWAPRVGALVFLLGALYFFKYAVDNDWIGPTGRVAIGVVVGVALVAAAELTRATTRPAFVHALTGIGLAVVYVAIWASASFYDLVPIAPAFAANTLVLLSGAALALRYRGEPVLVLSLLAAFLNPVLLSTGEDRPLALFTYLLLTTGAALWVAVRADFKIAPWLAVAGVVILFGGWYHRFFDAADRRAEAQGDLPTEQLVGAYFPLAARVVPLAFVGIFAAHWIATAFWMRSRGADKRVVQAMAVSALVLAHVGLALLLSDSARLMAAGAIALGLVSIFVLRALSAAQFLVVPMLAAFAALLLAASDVPLAQRTRLLVFLGLWTLLYLVAFVRGVARQPAPLTRAAALRTAAAAAAFGVLAAVLLIPGRVPLYAVIVTLVSLVALAVALAAGVRWLPLAALVASGLALAAAAPGILDLPGTPRLDPLFLAAAGAWSLVYLGGAAYDTVRQKSPLTWSHVFSAALAALGFVAVSLLSTSEDLPTLRALLTGAAGIVVLALGALLTREQPSGRDKSTVLVGLSLGLFAAAVALGVSGATVTVLWAALGAVAAAMAARSGERLALGLAGILLGAALIRAWMVDVADAEAPALLFLATMGRDGTLVPAVLFNPRAYALAGTGVAFLVAARLLSLGDHLGRLSAAVSGVLGYALVLALAVTELRAWATTLPAQPPYPLDAAEWSAFTGQYWSALDAQRGSLAMLTTLVMGLFAAALLAAGFGARSAFHRFLALALFAITLGKLALWDIWRIERVYQIVLLTAIGALLVAAGFLYARFGRRLVALVRGGTPGGGAAALLAVAFLGGGVEAQSLPVGRFRVVRPITGVTAPGDWRIEVDSALYQESLSAELLADVRIAGPDGREVPYLVREVDALAPVEEIPATMLDPSVGPDGSVYASWLVSPPGKRHCQIRLQIQGENFLRKVRVETGEGLLRLGVVAEGGYVYRIANPPLTSEHLVVSYPLSGATMVRVTLLPEANPTTSLRITGGALSCAPPDVEEPMQRVDLRIEEIRQDPEQRATVVTLDAGTEGLPLRAIHLDLAGGEFSRRASVTATNYRAVWPPAGEGMLYRVQPRAGFVLESTRLPTAPARKRWYRVTIDNGDSPPLELRSARAEIRLREIIFRAAAAGEQLLHAGDKLAAPPRYDLAEVLARAERVERPAPAALAPFRPNPRWGEQEEAAAGLPFSERYRRTIGIGLAALLLGLSLWAVRLLRRGAAS